MALVPQTESIQDVYFDERAAQECQARWNNLIKTFKLRYGKLPMFVARSPGRVNIIGEHIDYSLYNVLPTALSVDVLVAVNTTPSEASHSSVNITNAHDSSFAEGSFTISGTDELEIDATAHDWINYFKAGMRVALNFLKEKQAPEKLQPVNMEVLVDGNVPPGGGISSSAAFVCASALAVARANGYSISKQELFDISIVSERAVGVYSGGMDQAASIFSKRGDLLYVRFFPTFGIQHVPLPKANPEITFLVAQSFVTSNKAETAPKHYNLRVAECTIAAAILAKQHNIEIEKDTSSLGYSLRKLHHDLMQREGRLEDPLEYQLDSLILLVAESFTQNDGYTREEIAKLLDITVPVLEETYLSTFPVQAEKFYIRQRALHCFKEARRVLDFISCLLRSNHLDEHNIKYLGQLLNESQASCRDIYDCTCPEVDEICEIALAAGSFGSRVTGAGWGGCTVHMVPLVKIDNVISALKQQYYLKRFPDISEEKLNSALVISKPSNGSFLYVNDK
ncbi:galactokinase [Myotisia sp. PD_48]|nr:galactokinase [Myotisia sp. PD_48]